MDSSERLVPQGFSYLGEAVSIGDGQEEYVGRIIVSTALFPTLWPPIHVRSVYRLEIENVKNGKKKSKVIGREWSGRKYQMDKTLRVDDIAFTQRGLETRLKETITRHPLSHEFWIMQQMPDIQNYPKVKRHPIRHVYIDEQISYSNHIIPRKKFPK